MKTAQLKKLDKKAINKKLFDNGFVNEYENEVVFDILENRYKELYTKSQTKAVKLFYPNAEIKRNEEERIYIVRIDFKKEKINLD